MILITGRSDREHRLAGLRAGADDFLSKPFDGEHLRARIRSLARIKRFTDELDSAVSLRAALGLGKDDLAALKRGGFLHDVGKIGIPDAILLKEHPLAPDEYEQIKRHQEIGERLLDDLRSLAPVRPIVRHHHERLDGSGYPDGLRGAEVPLLAHIVSIVDTYDAMTTARPYRPAVTQAAAVAELRRDVAFGRMSRDLVEMFVAVIDGRRLDKIA